MNANALNNLTYVDQLISAEYVSRAWFEIGPTIIPWPLDSFLLGCLICQVINYQTSIGHLTDSIVTRIVVIVILVLSLVNTALVWRWSASALLTYAGHYWPYVATTYIVPFFIVTAIQVVIVQAYFAHRAFVLYKRKWVLAIVAMAFSLLGLTTGMGVAIQLSRYETLLESGTDVKVKILCNLFLASFMFAGLGLGVLIAVALVRASSGWKAGHETTKRLIFMMFETLLPATLLAFIAALHYGATTTLTIVIPSLQILGKLYSACLLFSLNSREYSREAGGVLPHSGEHELYKGETRAAQDEGTVNVAVETYIEVCEDTASTIPRRHAGLRTPSRDDIKTVDDDCSEGHRQRDVEEGPEEEKYEYASTTSLVGPK